MKKKKILYCEQNTDGTVGGSYYCLLELVQRLDRSRYEPLVVFYTDNSLIPRFEAAGVDTRIMPPVEPFHFSDWFGERSPLTLGLRPAQRLINTGRRLLWPALERARFLKREGVDLVHLNNSIVLCHDWMLGARLAGIPCITHERGVNHHFPWTARYFARRLEAIVSISGAVTENFRRHGIDYPNIEPIYDGIDVNRLEVRRSPEELRQTYGVPAQAPVIGVVGNIKRWKGQETVVRATAVVQRQHPDVRCFVVGAVGSERYHRYLRELCAELKIEDNVIFTGFQDNIADYMSLMDVVIHSSVDPEPFGIVLLEGMALQRPVVATNIGAPPEIIVDGESGLLVPPGDAEALAASVNSLLSDPQRRRRIGAAARQRVLNEFSIQRNIAKTEALYSRIFTTRATDAQAPAVSRR